MSSLLALVIVLAPAPKPKPTPPLDRWASWRWLGTPDERVLWAILATAALFAVWGAWHTWRGPRRGPRRSNT